MGRVRQLLAVDVRRPVRATLAGVCIAAMVAVVAPAVASSGRVPARSMRTSTVTKVSSPSVMIQLSSLTQSGAAASLATWLRQICPAGVVANGRLVLQDVASDNG